jgi:class 3 adenylate cyclase/tetratricopeptide (TPR) repeat protein
MAFDDILAQVLELLQRDGRVSYRALKVRFQLDDDLLEAVKDELIYAKHLAVDEENRVLVWTGEQASAATPSPALGTPALTASPPTEQERAPLAYTPQHLVEKILTSRTALEGERKQVTVLFADVSGFTALAERLDPEEVHQLMNRAFELILGEAHRYEGTINQFLGDGVMALFGAPIAHEDHAQRAVHAALGMQRVLQGYGAELQRTRGITFRMRMGLNTGLVVVGSIGDNLRMDYTAVGDTTNLAARMLNLAEPGQVVIAEDTHKAVSGYFVTRPLGERAIKGKAEPVNTYEVVRARGLRTRLEVGAERGLTPFVGREPELSLLQERWVEARVGRGQVICLMGEAGIGKSRLLLECQRRLADEPVTWLTGRCISYGKEMAYLPIIDLLKHNFQVEEGDDDVTVSAKIEQGMGALGAELQPAIPYIKSLLSVPPGGDTVLRLDAQQRRLRLFEALRAMMLQGGQRRPLVLVVEDLHWIDKTSEEVLLHLANSIPRARVLLFVTYRPGYRNPFGERTYTTCIGLRTLSDHDSLKLAAGMLAMAEFPSELRDLIIRKAEGNPFFLEEVLKSLLEMGALRQRDGRYILTKPIAEIYVPNTIQDVIMARIDRLEETPKRALQLASVIGREFTVRLLERISDVKGQLERFLQELKVLEFIYERSFYPELAYMFKHALTHDVAYNSLLMQRRKELHRLIAMAIEELYAERLPESYEMLAYHYERGEVWEKALEYLVKAGQKAQQAYANQEAREHYNRAVDICERLGGAVEPATRMTLYAGKGAVHVPLSEFRASIETYQCLLEVVRQLGDRHKEAEALYQIGFGFYGAHEFEQALEFSHQAQALAAEIGNQSILAASLFIIAQVQAVTGKLDEASHGFEASLRVSRAAGEEGREGFNLYMLGQLHSWKGEYEQALRLQEQSFTIGHAQDLQLLVIRILWYRGMTHGGQGEYTAALAALQDALTLSDRLGDKVFKCRVLNTQGWVYGEIYNLEAAIRYNREGAEASYQVGDPEIIRNAEINLGDDYLLLGDLEQAQRYLEKVYKDTQQRGKWGEEWMKWRYSQHLYHSLGELWLTKGDAAQALEFAEECLRLAEPTMSRKNLVKGWRLKGQALLAQGQGEQAEVALARALTLAREIGNPPQLWKTYQALGALYEWQADLERARVAYQSAMDMINEVAARLQDQELRRTFLAARPVQEIRERLVQAGRGRP